MLLFENIDANTFRMLGSNDNLKISVFPKNYEAKAVIVPYEDEPRISISHIEKGTNLATLKKFDEISIGAATFTTAEDAVKAFNVMIKTP